MFAAMTSTGQTVGNQGSRCQIKGAERISVRLEGLGGEATQREGELQFGLVTDSPGHSSDL